MRCFVGINSLLFRNVLIHYGKNDGTLIVRGGTVVLHGAPVIGGSKWGRQTAQYHPVTVRLQGSR